MKHLRCVSSTEKPTRRAVGKALLADVADIKRRRARILRERSDLDLKLALLEQEEAEKLAQIGGSDVELETGRKCRQPPEPVVHTQPGDLAERAAREVERLLP